MKALRAALLILAGSITSLAFGQTNTIPTNGNVGIGTLTPSAKLDVNGQMIVDSLVILKDSLYVQKKMEVEQDMKIKGKSVFNQDGKFKSDLTVVGVARMKDNLIIDGLTKMNGDAKIFGDLKIKGLEDLSITEDRILLLRPSGKVIPVSNTFFNDKPCSFSVGGPGQQPIVSSVWATKLNLGYGIIHTGAGLCEKTRVGIGTEDPEAELDVRGVGLFTERADAGRFLNTVSLGPVGTEGVNNVGLGTGYIGFNAKRSGITIGTWETETNGVDNGGATIYGDINGALLFATIASTGGSKQTIKDKDVKNNTRLFIHQNGNVGIGTEKVTDNYKLSVEGNIRARKVVVNADQWADYVFVDNYKLTPLSEVRTFIEKNNHLPDVPSEKEVKQTGIDLGEMDAILLKKIEELTLYILEQDKRIAELENK